MSDEQSYGFDTLQIHAGTEPDPATGARQVPIYQTTAYVFKDADHAARLFNLEEVGYIYSRLTNPTVSALQDRLNALEGGAGTVCCSSGHAAQIMALFPIMGPAGMLLSPRAFMVARLPSFQRRSRALAGLPPLSTLKIWTLSKPPSMKIRARYIAKVSPIRADIFPTFRHWQGLLTTQASR